MRYTIEQKAQGVAEYWLTGSQRRAAETLNLGSHHTIGEWARAAEAPKTAQHKKLAQRAQQIHQQRQTSLDELYQRALDLQLRDLEQADFRDRTGLIKIVGEQMLLQKRTGLIKIVGEQMLLQKGRPTSVQQAHSADQLDAEIAELLKEVAANGARPS
jgi:hypothetical protein